MSLMRNLMFAEAAVKYAEKFLRGRASNKPEDIIHTLQENLRKPGVNPEYAKAVLSNPYDVDRKRAEIYMNRAADIDNARRERIHYGVRYVAKEIKNDGIGNCFEHAVLACHFLVRHHGI